MGLTPSHAQQCMHATQTRILQRIIKSCKKYIEDQDSRLPTILSTFGKAVAGLPAHISPFVVIAPIINRFPGNWRSRAMVPNSPLLTWQIALRPWCCMPQVLEKGPRKMCNARLPTIKGHDRVRCQQDSRMPRVASLVFKLGYSLVIYALLSSEGTTN